MAISPNNPASGIVGTLQDSPGGGSKLFQFVREQYNLVTLDWGDGSPLQTYVEPICGNPIMKLAQAAAAPAVPVGERLETYDNIRFYDSPPYPFSRVGYTNTSVAP